MIINSVDGGASVPNLRTARFCLRSRESQRFCCSYISGRQFSPAIYVLNGSWNVPRHVADLSTDPFHCSLARTACQFRCPTHLARNTDAVRTLLAGAAPMQQSHNQAIGRIGELTGREQQVAKLAKSGLSNKGIAKSLGLSEGTVKHHLHSVFQKLGIRSRSALQQP